MEQDENSARQSNNPERGERILDAAYRLLMRFGYDKTTISDIAREAGVSKGAIYLHYKSREALFQALVLRETVRYGDFFFQSIEDDPSGGTLAAMYRHSIQGLEAYPLVKVIMARDSQILGSMLREIDPKVYLSSYLLRTEFIRRMQAAGLIRPEFDPQGVGFILALIGQGYLMINEIIPPDQAPSMETFVETLSLLLENGLDVPLEGDSQTQQARNEQGKAIYKALLDDIRQTYRPE